MVHLLRVPTGQSKWPKGESGMTRSSGGDHIPKRFQYSWVICINFVPTFKKTYWHPNLQYFKMWPTLEIGLWQIHVVKMWSYWKRVGLYSSTTGALIRKGPGEDRETHGGTAVGLQRQRWELCNYEPRKPPNCQQTTRSQVSEGACPVTPWLQTSRLQYCETTNSCCWKPPSLWYFVMTALGNSYTGSVL